MKKVIVFLLAAASLAIAARFGYHAGIIHAIEDAEVWTVDVYDPLAPESSAWNGYDQRIIIELDGHIYEHGMTQC